MGRKVHRRCVRPQQNNIYFANEKPSLDNIIILTVAEFEAMRLKHNRKLDQKESAEKMGISQSTFSRILESAHYKNTLALIEGKQIKIYDEIFDHKNEFISFRCIDCKNEWFEKNVTRNKRTRCVKCRSSNVYYLE